MNEEKMKNTKKDRRRRRRRNIRRAASDRRDGRIQLFSSSPGRNALDPDDRPELQLLMLYIYVYIHVYTHYYYYYHYHRYYYECYERDQFEWKKLRHARKHPPHRSDAANLHLPKPKPLLTCICRTNSVLKVKREQKKLYWPIVFKRGRGTNGGSHFNSHFYSFSRTTARLVVPTSRRRRSTRIFVFDFILYAIP